ncbi:cytochrome b/b6 domain-containing protein [Ideonella margarita]|uniref:Cytochrome b/b6 domain-containing protein n=1 Tax=Ideonella margarita TaxID=2984191 RepID=A0ABU9C4Z5_9BURK
MSDSQTQTPSTTPAVDTQPVRVWDLPTRLFHWLLVVGVVALVATGQIGGNLIEVHLKLGLGVGALLVFRLVWGLVGGRWSRFTSFIYGPAAMLRYLRGQSRPDEHVEVGHNPLGMLSVLGLLAVLLVQVATGLVADDEIATTGPLNRFVSPRWVSLATSWHTQNGKLLLILLVLLHVGAIVFYLKRKRINLVKPMVTGDKPLPAVTPASRDSWVTRVLAAVLLAACIGTAVWVNSLGAVAAF